MGLEIGREKRGENVVSCVIFVDSSLVVVIGCGGFDFLLTGTGRSARGSEGDLLTVTALLPGSMSSQEDAPDLGRFVEHCFDWI
jgi:hypothetical protein